MPIVSTTQPAIRARMLPRFPASVVAGNGITITKSGLTYTFEVTESTGTVVVGLLPAAGTAGRRRVVSDATVTTFASVVVGGGSNVVPVYDDGTDWRIG